MRWTSKSSTGDITLQGTKEEMEAILGLLNGAWGVRRGENGDVTRTDLYAPPVTPQADPCLPDGWQRRPGGQVRYQELDLAPDPLRNHLPGILIQHLCGYDYTRKNYAEAATFLEECGFTCLRSRRDKDGRFDEHWWLSGTWCAAGRLQQHLEQSGIKRFDDNAELATRLSVSWLIRNVPWGFGTLEVVVQRACMVIT
jgi:hypothetical protein